MKKGKTIIAFVSAFFLSGCFSMEDEINDTNSYISNSSEYEKTESEITETPMFWETYPNEDKYEKVKINDYTEVYRGDSEDTVKGDYEHIRFSENVIIKDIGTPEKIAYYSAPIVDVSADESIELIKKWLKDNNKEVNLEEMLKNASGEHRDPQTGEIAKVSEYNDWKNGSWFSIEADDCGLMMGGFDLCRMSTGVISKAVGSTQSAFLDAYGVYTQEEVEKGYVDDLSEKEYELLCGKMSIGDAAKVAKEYLKKGVLQPLPEGMDIDIPLVSVTKLSGLEKYCYVFTARRVYYGMPMDYSLGGNNPVGEDNMSGDSTLLYVASGQVDALCGSSLAFPWVKMGNETDEIISLKTAMKLLDDYLPFNQSYEVKRIEFAYIMRDSVDEIDDEPIYYPCWCLRAKAKSSEKNYSIFVNAITGDVYMGWTKENSL